MVVQRDAPWSRTLNELIMMAVATGIVDKLASPDSDEHLDFFAVAKYR